jgi:hypothetical protein
MLDLSLYTFAMPQEKSLVGVEEADWQGGSPHSCVGHKFSDKNKLRQFQEKWGLAECSDYSTLLFHTRMLRMLHHSAINDD